MKKVTNTKRTLALILALMVIVSCMPTVAFADREPQRTDGAYNDNETTLVDAEQSIVTNADEAEKQAGIAAEKAKDAAQAVAEAEAQATAAQTAATAAGTTASTADANAEAALTELSNAKTSKSALEADIKDSVDKSVKIIDGKKSEAEAQATAAQTAAEDAAKYRAEAFAADNEADAKAAAKKAGDAAKAAETAYGKAQTAYDDAVKELATAQATYKAKVAEAQQKIDEYNTKVGNLAGLVTAANADMAKAESEYNAAVAAAAQAKLNADQAKADADTAAQAATTAAEAAMNFYVNPAKIVRDNAETAYNTAVSERIAAQNVQTQKQGEYDAAIGRITEAARAAQDAVVAQKQQAVNEAQAAVDEAQRDVDNCGWYDYLYGKGEYYKIVLAKKKSDLKDAKEALDAVKSESAYNATINSYLASSPENQALQAAINDVTAKQNIENQKNADFEAAKTDLSNKETTRDGYVAAVKNELAANGDEAARKIVADLKAYVDSTKNEVNTAEYYSDLYDWAIDVFASWDKVEQGKMRKDTADYLEAQKQKVDFWQKVGNISILTAWLTDRSDVLDEIEKTYRNELYTAERKAAFSQAYVSEASANVAADAAAKAIEASTAAATLKTAEETLAAAKLAYEAAAAKVANLEKLSLDTAAAETALANAAKAVESAATAVRTAKNAFDKATKAAKEAKQAYADARFFVLIPGEYRPTEPGSQPTKHFTDLLGTIAIKTDAEVNGRGVVIAKKNENDNLTILNKGAQVTYLTEQQALETENGIESVEAALKTRAYGDFDAQVKEIEKKALEVVKKTYPELKITINGRLYEITGIDWYQLKSEGDGIHVDGEIAVKRVTTVKVTHEYYTVNEETGEKALDSSWTADTVYGDDTYGTWDADTFTAKVLESETHKLSADDSTVVISNVNAEGAAAVLQYINVVPAEKPDIPTPPQGGNGGNGGRSHRVSQIIEEDIQDEEVPLSDLPVDLNDQTEEVVIEDEEVPLADLPATGGMGVGLFLLAGAALAGAGVGLRRKNDEE